MRNLRAIKVKVKSLAVEAAIIRQEERGAKASFLWCENNGKPECRQKEFLCYESLRNHRIYDLRKEQRVTLLAYAYLRGRAYSSCERHPWTRHSGPDLDRVCRMVSKFGGGLYTISHILEWARGKEASAFAKPKQVEVK